MTEEAPATPVGQVEQGVRRAARTLHRYVTLIGWLLRDSVWRFKWRAAVTIGVGVVGQLLQPAAIAWAGMYARLFQKDEAFAVLGMEFPARSLRTLALFSIGTLVAFTISAFMMYYSESRILHIAREHIIFCARRVFELVGRHQRLWCPGEGAACTNWHVLQVSGSDARFCGRSLRVVLKAVRPLAMFVAALATLIYTNVLLSILLLALLLIAMPFFYRISRFGALSSIEFEAQSRTAREDQKEVLAYLRGVSHQVHSERGWLKSIFESGNMASRLVAWQNRLISIDQTTLVTNLLFGGAAFLIMLVFGWASLEHKENWGLLAIYLGALVYCMRSLRGVSGSVANVNRFYPMLRRYHDFVTSASAPLSPVAASGPEATGPYDLSVAGEALPGSDRAGTVRPGTRLHLLAPAEVNRYTLPFLFDCLLRPGEEELNRILGTTWFVSSEYGCPPIPLGQFLGLPQGAPLDEAARSPEEQQVLGRLREEGGAVPGEAPSPEAWNGIEDATKSALALMAARNSAARWVVLDQACLSALPEALRASLLEGLDDRIVIIVSAGTTEAVGRFGEGLVAVTDGRWLVGLGSVAWAREQESAIGRRLLEAQADVSLAWTLEGFDQDEEEEDVDDDM